MSLYDNMAANMLLGAILNKSQLAISDRYNITTDFFYDSTTKDGKRFHSLIFACCQALAYQGVEEIDIIDVGEFYKSYPKQFAILEEHDYQDFIERVKESCDETNFEHYYNVVKKFAVLRQCKKEGFDISPLYNENNEEATERQKLDNYSVEDIIKYFEEKALNIKKIFYKDKEISEYRLSDDLYEVVNGFKHTPLFGYTTMSEYLNTITRGLIKGQLTIMSMMSGFGKTTIGSEACAMIGCKRIFDWETHSFIDNPNYSGQSVLYIQYEMDDKMEFSPRIIGAVAKVSTKRIIDGVLNEDEEQRVNEAIKAINESDINVVTMPNFTINTIEDYVKEYNLVKNLGLVVFDYISAGSAVNSEMAKSNKVSMREDMTLSAISSALKEMARKYDVAVLTFTQVNANIHTQDVLDAGCIAGSRAVQNKADVAMIVHEVRGKEKPFIDLYLSNEFKLQGLTPNRICHCYKVRFGSHEQGIKVWGYLNLGTGEWTDMFVTNKYNEPISIDKMRLFKFNG